MIGGGFLYDYLGELKENYILIGGNALALNLKAKGVDFRETVDLDIVIVIRGDGSDNNFFEKVDRFILDNGYVGKKFNGSTPGGSAFRFTLCSEGDEHTPKIIEFFSRKPEYFEESKSGKRSHITPIETGDGISNLSAILLDDNVYNYIISSKISLGGISTVKLECILGLKCVAWMGNKELFESKIDGITEYTVRKHMQDIITISSTIDEPSNLEYPDEIIKKIKQSKITLEQMQSDGEDEEGMGLAIYFLSAIPGVSND